MITLRKAAYDRVAEELQDVPGASTAPGSAPLAPTKDFARALLGAVGPATAEQVEKSKGRLAPGRRRRPVGSAGARSTSSSPGASRRSVVDPRRRRTASRRRHCGAGAGPRRENLETTLDLDVQRAAERALGTTNKKAALVALQPSTGDVLAVANRPDGLDARSRPDRPATRPARRSR